MMNYKKIHPLKIFFLVLAIVSLIAGTYFFQKYSLEIIHWVDHLGWLAPLLFLIIYSLATIMLLPTMVITLAGGAIFGPVFGTVLNLFGATLGAAFSFLITRHWLYNWFSKRKGERLDKLISEVNQKGWMIVAILRVFPIIPFNLVNYGLGITAIKFRLYFITTFIFLIPAEIVYTYFGYAGMEAILQQGVFYRNSGIVLSTLAILVLFVIKFLNFNKLRDPH